MKRVFLVLLAVILVVGLIFVGCTKEVTPTTPTTPTAPTAPTTPAAPAAWGWPDMLAILAHPTTSTGYIATAAWTPLLEAQTGMKVRITPMEGDVAKFRWMRTGKYDLLTMPGPGFVGCMEGQAAMATREGGPHQERLVWRILNFYEAPWVRGDSPLKELKDLYEGIRVGYDSGKGTGLTEAKAVVAWSGLDPEKDVVYVPGDGLDPLVDLMLEGKLDFMPYGALTSAYMYRAAAGPHGIRFLEYDPVAEPEAAKRFLAYTPDKLFLVATSGVEEARGIKAVAVPYFYLTLPDEDTELVYNLVKWLDENFDAYKDKDFRCADMSLEPFIELLDMVYAPVHDGVIKYLEEKGLWTQRREDTYQYSLELMTSYEQAYAVAIADAEAKGIAVDPTNDIWLEYWENYKKELGLPRFSPLL